VAANSSYRRRRRAALAAGLCLIGVPARAASTNANVPVAASVVGSCSVNSPTLDFGTYRITQASTAQVTIAVLCNSGTTASVALNLGLNGGKSAAGTRALANGTHYLGYDIYQNGTFTLLWNQTFTVQFTSTGTVKNLTAFGRIPAGQAASYGGAYSDSVSITVTF
jgi:spore coat protein U-like protein